MRREESECSAGSRHLTAITATVLQKTRQLNFAGRAWLQQKFDALGLEYVPSHANFVMVNVGDGNAVFQALMARGIIVRAMASYQLPEWIRVTVGIPRAKRPLPRRAPAPAARRETLISGRWG